MAIPTPEQMAVLMQEIDVLAHLYRKPEMLMMYEPAHDGDFVPMNRIFFWPDEEGGGEVIAACRFWRV